jgi:trk system potassium uptake protein TrkA
MRIVIIGASRLGVRLAEEWIKAGQRVLIIEKDRQRIEILQDKLDCGFLHGDGSQPGLLREADPGNTDLLLCLSSHDQSNIIAGLAARSLGYKRVITLVEEESYLPLCEELGLEDVLVPTLSLSHRLQKMAESKATYDAGDLQQFGAGLYALDVTTEMLDEQGRPDLPKKFSPLWFFREDKLYFLDDGSGLLAGDRLILLGKGVSTEELKKFQQFQ